MSNVAYSTICLIFYITNRSDIMPRKYEPDEKEKIIQLYT